jgi:FlaA1/EpsC-like NDP-sugar epimerase
VFGTQVLVELAGEHDVERLVMISSDKAVNPTSIMGVTKRVAELVVRDAAQRTGKDFVVVRFGNVLGSSGSVVPIFQEQIQRGGPLLITHPEVTRFFMTIPEAVQLVLQAATIGRGGETLVLDMGEPIKILDLAKDMLRLSGLDEGVDIDIAFTGLQKGEKMYEELFYVTEKPEFSSHEKIFICRNGNNDDAAPAHHRDAGMKGSAESSPVIRDVDLLVGAARVGQLDLVYQLLKKIVPEYSRDGCSTMNPDVREVWDGKGIPDEKAALSTPGFVINPAQKQ